MIYKIYSAQYKYFLYLSRFYVFLKNIKILKVLPFLFLSLIYSQEILAQIESLYDPKKDQFANISNLMSATSNNDIDGVRFFSKSGSLIVTLSIQSVITSWNNFGRWQGWFECRQVRVLMLWCPD